MTTIAFFGHDAGDAAIRRRVKAFLADGFSVKGYMMRRGVDEAAEWDNIDLGQTFDGAFFQRIFRIFSGARRAAKHKVGLEAADFIYARNLDMLACAFLAKRHLSLETPVIYECLDVHRLLVRKDIIGRSLRWLERVLLRRSHALIVSSPGFLTNHFERYYKGEYRAFLLENRLSACSEFTARPKTMNAPSKAGYKEKPLQIGWVGVLRCQRSFDLLKALADRFGPKIEIHLHGKPARTEIAVFEPEIDCRENMIYHGPYKAPEDLLDIYKGLDLVWAGDFMEAGYNSVWLLPNRLYEGGYYVAPPIVPAQTESANWVKDKGCGFVLQEPLYDTLPNLIGDLLEDPTQIERYRAQLAQLPDEVFIQPSGALASIFEEISVQGAVS